MYQFLSNIFPTKSYFKLHIYYRNHIFKLSIKASYGYISEFKNSIEFEIINKYEQQINHHENKTM